MVVDNFICFDNLTSFSFIRIMFFIFHRNKWREPGFRFRGDIIFLSGYNKTCQDEIENIFVKFRFTQVFVLTSVIV